MSKDRKEIISLALLIGLLPPLWAIASSHLGNSVGAIALICAGLYVANGNVFADSHRMAIGFILGDFWSLITNSIMRSVSGNTDIYLFLVLFILGFAAVLIAHRLNRYIYLPSWLSGWAIGMLAMSLDTITPLTSLAVQIAIAMLVGVYYVGALLDKIHRTINKK